MGKEQIHEEWLGRVAVVAMSGELDMATAPQLDEAVQAALAKKPTGLIVDLLGLTFLASAGMQLLIEICDQITPGTRFAVVADGPATSRPMKITGVTDVIDVFSTRDVALNSFSECNRPDSGM
ncbi:anti-anti-sigma factor [Mycobacterium sp. ACS1612]|uniref:STAS domain-containing protein n=1 Tax=Mycobacterium sp. ACS1612 TaxID=1834117 RepID=UPI0007FF96DA|nr:STAS domain-containing protein [Mycobacterium sp. ACS1612]OBF30259.1 anti-anti-sigma factor [Mycobacterium sp. ACS1612]